MLPALGWIEVELDGSPEHIQRVAPIRVVVVKHRKLDAPAPASFAERVHALLRRERGDRELNAEGTAGGQSSSCSAGGENKKLAAADIGLA